MGYPTLGEKQSDHQLGYVHRLSTSWTKTPSARTARDLYWWSDGNSNRFRHWQSSHEVSTDCRVAIRIIFGRGQKFKMPDSCCPYDFIRFYFMIFFTSVKRSATKRCAMNSVKTSIASQLLHMFLSKSITLNRIDSKGRGHQLEKSKLIISFNLCDGWF